MHPQLQSLQQEAAGLLVISESEAALEAFELAPGEAPENGLLRLAALPAGTPVEIQDAAPFFEKQERMYSDQPEGARFRSLGEHLSAQLTELRLYRAGNIRIEAFLLGTLPDGTRGGLRTQLIET
ncbi:nuclease A inhibitor family protein [Flaviaesturariibacter terrae]